MAIEPLFQRHALDQIVGADLERLFDLAFDRDLPGPDRQRLRVLPDVLGGAELVIIVVGLRDLLLGNRAVELEGRCRAWPDRAWPSDRGRLRTGLGPSFFSALASPESQEASAPASANAPAPFISERRLKKMDSGVAADSGNSQRTVRFDQHGISSGKDGRAWTPCPRPTILLRAASRVCYAHGASWITPDGCAASRRPSRWLPCAGSEDPWSAGRPPFLPP